MAAPKTKATPPKPKVPAKTVKTPFIPVAHGVIVNKATGFTTGSKTIAATKSNPKTTSTALSQAKRVAAARKGPFEQVGDFIANRVGQMTGKIATPISGAMKNKTPGSAQGSGYTVMAAPKATPKPVAKTVKTPIVNKATGFTVGTKAVKVTKSNPKTTSLPKPAPTKDPWSTGKIGEFVNSAVGQMTGKIATPISGAMKNKTPVIPYTQRNVKAIKKASGK